MEIKYNRQIEVTQTQFATLKTHFKGVIAHRIENGKYFIKVLLMSYANDVKSILSLTPPNQPTAIESLNT